MSSQRGRLSVLLGAAPGVGKTYAMLEEGHRLAKSGVDVVIALVETRGRAATAAIAEGLPTIARARYEHRGTELHEIDLDAVLERKPAVALVDELAHTNAPGARHEKRWQDVETLLDAGIDVISTINIQHIASLNDVVEQITGVAQQETVPDSLLRGANQIELVDLAPPALRDRLAAGFVYPAERIDAALAHYFRLGNLTALRELALIWLADEVDQALNSYRAEQGIARTWEARERVVVALTGGAEGETLLRRGARIAARSAGGELITVHVTNPDGLRSENPATLSEQRALVEQLNGSYHQVVGDDVPAALVDFARSVNATQLVLGASRRGFLQTALTGSGIGATVVRESGDIDVHIVNHAAAGKRAALPSHTGALTKRRKLLGFALTALLGPLLTAVLHAFSSPDSITTEVLSFQVLVVIVALVGGIWPAMTAALFSGLTLDFFFIAPLYTVHIHQPQHFLALVLTVIIAMLVSLVVDRAARFTRAARRSAAEAELLQTIAGSVLRGDSAVQVLIDHAQSALDTTGARLLTSTGDVLAESVPFVANEQHSLVPVTEHTSIELHGPALAASDQRVLAVIVAQLAASLEHQDLADAAALIEPIAASDRVRGALLNALSHDLRRPLASATAAVGGLRAAAEHLSSEDREELITTADESLASLTTLVTDLLDVSRLHAGAVTLAEIETDPGQVIASALDELALGPDDISLDLNHEAAVIIVDPVLLHRSIVNLLTNAHRYAPVGSPVHVSTSTFADRLEIRVVDHGPGIPEEKRDGVFVPFQRLGDTDNSTGLGLGLALSRGFIEAMHGTLTPEHTPGGGLTMVISLPALLTESAPEA